MQFDSNGSLESDPEVGDIVAIIRYGRNYRTSVEIRTVTRMTPTQAIFSREGRADMRYSLKTQRWVGESYSIPRPTDPQSLEVQRILSDMELVKATEALRGLCPDGHHEHFVNHDQQSNYTRNYNVNNLDIDALREAVERVAQAKENFLALREK